jgi:hypothetical protein
MAQTEVKEQSQEDGAKKIYRREKNTKLVCF